MRFADAVAQLRPLAEPMALLLLGAACAMLGSDADATQARRLPRRERGSARSSVLAAQSLGLGTTFMNGYLEAGVKEVIGVADRPEIAIAVILPIGHPLEVPTNPGRFARGERVFEERLP